MSDGRALLLATLLAAGCFDLSRVSGGALDAAVVDDAASSICPSDTQPITSANLLMPSQAGFGGNGDGAPAGWGAEGGASPGAATSDGCIVPGSTWFCAPPVDGNHFIQGPPVQVIAGASYRMRAWIRAGAPADGAGYAQGHIYLQDAQSQMGPSYAYTVMGTSWTEIDTQPMVVGADMGSPRLSPFLSLTPAACVVMNYVSVERVTP